MGAFASSAGSPAAGWPWEEREQEHLAVLGNKKEQECLAMPPESSSRHRHWAELSRDVASLQRSGVAGGRGANTVRCCGVRNTVIPDFRARQVVIHPLPHQRGADKNQTCINKMMVTFPLPQLA